LNLDNISELFDNYGRTARLYPAVVVLLPLTWHLPLLGSAISLSLPEGAVAAAIGCATLYLLAAVARHKGKQAEPRLLSLWGGWPTSILLRHRDGQLDPVTKSRYHAAIVKLSGLAMPSPAEEQVQPDQCEAMYRTATKFLLEARRGDAYGLVHKDNAAYGFRRNLFGLRGIALALGTIMLVSTAAIWTYQYNGVLTVRDVFAALKLGKAWLAAVVLDIVYLALFAFIVTPNFVRQSADDYATALLRTLDQPAP
jgi:hypothetical protein